MPPTPDNNSMRSPDWFRRGQQLSRCVARIWVDGNQGTGILLPGNWLLTNNHILPDAATAASPRCKAQFNYEEGADGFLLPLWESHFDPQRGFHTSDARTGDDWTVVKLKRDANSEFGSIPLEKVAPNSFQPGAEISIIQQPEKGPKRLAICTQSVVPSPPRRLHYCTATAGGSSGSPVFNQNLQVVALHDGRKIERDPETAEPVYRNVGIHIDALLEGLINAGVCLAACVSQRPNGDWIIQRNVETRTLKYLQRNRVTIALKGSPLVGKSMLVERVAAKLGLDGWRRLDLDLAHEFIEEHYERGFLFLREIARKVHLQIGGSASVLDAFANDATPSAFVQFFRNLQEEHKALKLLLNLDRMDALIGTPACSVVLNGFYLLHKDLQLKPFPWMQIVLIHTTTPGRVGKFGSAFDVAQSIDVDDFNIEELRTLAQSHSLADLSVPDLHLLTGGHPGLCQESLHYLNEEGIPLDEFTTEVFRTGGPFKSHLDSLHQDFRAQKDPVRLARAFRNVLAGKPLESEEDFEILRSLGVVRGTYRGDALPRCQMYSRWLDSRLPR